MSPYLRRLRSKIGHALLLPPSVAAVIKDGEGRILRQEKSSGEGWCLPACAIEPGETPEQAICREVGKETGLLVQPPEILGVGWHSLTRPRPSSVPKMSKPFLVAVAISSNPTLGDL
jgi:8-oxo-dGTP pyrophosphatase MutT (NUDIX family)